MNKKIISIVLCLAMMLSALAVSTYAAVVDVEIDLGGGFFGDDDETTVGTGGEGTDDEDEEDSEPADDGDDEETTTPSGKTDGKGSSHSRYEGLIKDEEEEQENTPAEWVNNFTDVKESDWFYAAVKFAGENSIMNGISDSEFGHSTPLTRAMLVTVLYRAEGSPRIESDSKFSDVEITDWFGAAVIWASENGIVNGVSDTEFAPNNNITREQIATILYRYAGAKKYDTTQGGMAVKEFSDYETISSWAKEAMQWAVNAKLINGKTATTVNPVDKATRAEAATIIMRFIEANK